MSARSAILALVIVCLAGCSGVKLAYNQADSINPTITAGSSVHAVHRSCGSGGRPSCAEADRA